MGKNPLPVPGHIWPVTPVGYSTMQWSLCSSATKLCSYKALIDTVRHSYFDEPVLPEYNLFRLISPCVLFCCHVCRIVVAEFVTWTIYWNTAGILSFFLPFTPQACVALMEGGSKSKPLYLLATSTKDDHLRLKYNKMCLQKNLNS